MRKQMNFDFVGKKKKFALVSLCILVVGILCNVFMGAKLDIQFTGGSIIKYSYNGDISEQAVQDALKPVTGGNESLQFNYNVYAANSDGAHNMLSVSLSEKNQLSSEDQQAMLDALKKAFPDAAVTQIESNSVEATMGQEFFWKCMVAVVLASLLMLVYVAFRFRKIGGWSAGLMAVSYTHLDVYKRQSHTCSSSIPAIPFSLISGAMLKQNTDLTFTFGASL